ncbi:MAG: hypothetical protein Q9207_002584 [Kuettlingeria erythrocarpa]
MSSSGMLSVSRTTTSSALLRRSARGYCWSRRHQWSLNTYPKSLSYQEYGKDAHLDRLPYRSILKDLSRYNYPNLPREIGRSSSSWARWKSQWSEFNPDRVSRDKSKSDEDYTAWIRHFDSLKKDAADMHRLLKERIEADPFDALFGRRFLYPNRAAAWSKDGSPRSPKAGQEKHDTHPEQGRDKDDGGQRQRHQNVSTSDCKATRHAKAPSSGVASTLDDRFTARKSVIDPITMRKIPQESANKFPKPAVSGNDSNISFDIPVKTFNEDTLQQLSRPPKVRVTSRSSTQPFASGANSNESKHEPREENWLKQQGFGNRIPEELETEWNEAHDNRTAPQGISDDSARAPGKLSWGTRSSSAQSGLIYDPEENKTEDVDLLRASDVRAASGLGTRSKRETEEERRQRRDRLEARFNENLRNFGQSEGLLRESMNGLVEIKQTRKEADARKAYEAYEAGYANEISEHKAAMEAMQTRQGEAPTTGSVPAHAHPEQGEGDMAKNVYEFATRERWYKRKAPHATGLEEPRAVQAAKDAAFVKEIRGIYEDTYGTIDTQHRQSTAAADAQQIRENDNGATPAPSLNQESEARERKTIPPTGPLSSQEKMGTMLRQVFDDLQHMQKLLKNHGLSGPDRSELFFRNRNMRNASDAIAEALSPTPTKYPIDVVGPSSRPTTQTAARNLEEPPKPEAQPTESKKPSMVYCVLAYDPSTQQVTTAEMSSPSDSPSERRLSLSEALSSLTEPAKFLPHLTTLQSQGYEIVSSDTNILVLRKSHKAPSLFSEPSLLADEKPAAGQKEGRRNINPIDGTTTQTGNFASPTGFVNHDWPLPPDALESEEFEQQPSCQTVRRKEDVFSGPRGNQGANRHSGDASKRRSKFRRGARGGTTAKRMMWVSLWTASCCYAVGVITEYLRA